MATLSDEDVGLAPAAPAKSTMSDADVGLTPTVSGAEALGRGVKSGLLMDFGDEISGASAAGTAGMPDEAKSAISRSPVASGLAALGGGIRMGAEYLFPDTFGTKGGEAYTKGRDAEREANKAAQRDHEYIYAGGALAGSVVAPGAAYKKGAGLVYNGLRQGGTGLAQGAVQGAGDAETMAEAPGKVATGALLSGGLGASLPFAGAAIMGAGRGARHLGQSMTDDGRRAIAERKVLREAAADRGAPNADVLSRADVDDASAAGQDILVGDLGGRRLGNLGRTAGNINPDAAAQMAEATTPRFLNQNARTAQQVDDQFAGGLNMTETNDALLEKARLTNGPKYDAAHAAGDQIEMWDDTLERLANAPAITKAMRGVEESAANAAVLDGYKPVRNPFAVDADGNMSWKVLEDGSTVTPNLSYWDHVQRNLQKQIDSADSKTERAQLIQLKNQLNGHLDNLVPEFGEARKTASDFFGAENMLKAGQEFASKNSGRAFTDAQQVFARATPVEQELFQRGMVSEIVQKVRTAGDSRDIAKLFEGANRQKLQAFLPPERLDQIEGFVRRERIMNRFKGALGANSTTAAQTQAMKDFGLDATITAGGTGIGTLAGDYQTGGIMGFVAAMGRRGRAGINRKVAEHVGDIMSSKDPAVMNKILGGPDGPQVVSALREIEEELAQVGTRASTGGQRAIGNDNSPRELTIRPDRAADGFAEGGLVKDEASEEFMRDLIEQIAARVRGGDQPQGYASGGAVKKLVEGGLKALKGGGDDAAKAAPKPAEDLFDMSRLSEVPKVEQFDLPRNIPPRGVPARTQEIIEDKDVREKMLSTIEEGRKLGGPNWYNADPLRDEFVSELGSGGDDAFRKYMDFVAATSPRSDVGTNARNASYYYQRHMKGEGMPAVGDRNPQPYGHMAQRLHQMNAERVAGEGWDPLNNPKPASFAQNLMGNQRPATIDTHAFRLPAILGQDPRFLETAFQVSKDAPKENIQKMVLGGDLSIKDVRPAQWQSMPKDNEYAAMERYYQGLGQELGLTPAQTQASAWVGGGKTTGLGSDESKPFLGFFQERVHLTAQRFNMDPKDVLKKFIRGEMPLLSVGGAGAAGGLSSLSAGGSERREPPPQ